MRRLIKVLIGLLVILVVSVGLLWFFWWYQISPLEALASQSPAAQPVVEKDSEGKMTAKMAFTAAEPVALRWASDAQLLNVRTKFSAGSNFHGGQGEWTLVFYSPDKISTALISVLDNKATFINERKGDYNPELQSIEIWHIDSPEVVDLVLKDGGNEFLRDQPGAVLILFLDMEGQGDWKGRFIHKETRRTFVVQLGAETGEIIALQQTG